MQHDFHSDVRTRLGFLILVGGHSRRMGMDKWQLKWGEQTFLERLIEIGRTTANQTVVSIGYDQQIPLLDPLDPQSVQIIRDAAPDLGPLEGLRTGLHHLAEQGIELAFVTACDHPEIDADWVKQLAARIESYQAVVPRIDGQWYGLNAVYRTSLAPSIESMLRSRGLRVQDWVTQLEVRPVEPSDLTRWGLNARCLNNVNTPQAYDDLRHRHNG